MAVPDMADLCIVDLLEPDGSLKGVATSATDPSDAAELRDQRLRSPLDPAGQHPVAIAARTGKPQLLPEMPEEDLRRFSRNEEHLELMLRLRYRSAIVVPLSARGRTLGVLSLLRFAGELAYDEQDFAIARDLARRAALAMDNARLFSELRRTESQLEAILTNLSEAVTVQDGSGELVFANQAAADIMGSATPEELLATPVAEIGARFRQFDEQGEPFSPDRFPGRLALRGERPEPVVMRQVDRVTHARALGAPRCDADPRRRRHHTGGDRHRGHHRRHPRRAHEQVPGVGLEAAVFVAGRRIDDRQGGVGGRSRGRRLVRRAHARRAREPARGRRRPHGSREARARASPAGELSARPGRTRGPLGGHANRREPVVRRAKDEDLTAMASDAEQLALLRDLGIRSALVAPLGTAGNTVGTITLVNDR